MKPTPQKLHSHHSHAFVYWYRTLRGFTRTHFKTLAYSEVVWRAANRRFEKLKITPLFLAFLSGFSPRHTTSRYVNSFEMSSRFQCPAALPRGLRVNQYRRRPILYLERPPVPRANAPSPLGRGQTRGGFTLIEMVVTIGIVAVIMVTVTQSVIFFYKANRVSFEESYQIRSAQRGIETLVRDVREATWADNGAYPLASMASSSITFYSDVDHSAPIERIHYQLSGTRLTRTVTNSVGTPPQYTGATATSTVSDYVRNFGDAVSLFRYYNASGVEVTDPAYIADVVSVSVNVVVDITPVHAPGEFTLKSGATFRNLRPQ